MVRESTKPNPEDTAAHAQRVLDRMRQTPHGPKRARLAGQHVDLCKRADWERGYLAGIDAMRSALRAVRADIMNENGLNGLSITCTVWHEVSETTVDFIDSVLHG